MTYRIFRVDNFARETVADKLVCDNISSRAAGEIMLAALRNYYSYSQEGSDARYILVDETYIPCNGMADFV